MSRLTRDRTDEPVSRDQILRHVRGQGNIHFPCSADHEQDWQPCPVDPYSAICDDHTYIHTYASKYLTLFTFLYKKISLNPLQNPNLWRTFYKEKSFIWLSQTPLFSKKNLNATKPCEHSPSGVNLSKSLGGNIACRDKNSSWY